MPKNELDAYLQDHFAGSAAALDLISTLAAEENPELRRVLARLEADIRSDQDELEALMTSLGIEPSSVRQAGAWVAAKAATLKMRLEDDSNGLLLRLQSLEILSLGIEGKLALWRALDHASASIPSLRGPDYSRLEQRATEQRAQVEAQRLDTARVAFAA